MVGRPSLIWNAVTVTCWRYSGGSALLKVLIHETTGCVKSTRCSRLYDPLYNQLYNLLYNPLYNQLYNLLYNRCLHFTTPFHVCIHDAADCTTRCTTGAYTLQPLSMFVYTMQPIVQPVVQLVVKPLFAHYNRLDVCVHHAAGCTTRCTTDCKV